MRERSTASHPILHGKATSEPHGHSATRCLTSSAGVVAGPSGRGAGVGARPAQRIVAARAEIEAAFAAGSAEIDATARAVQARPPCLCRLGGKLIGSGRKLGCGSAC